MHAIQGTLDELGTPLAQVTFVVVDLETTGGSAADNRITEIGAVKVRGGQVLAEFQTLVNPGEAIPAFISVLTGITDAMVAQAPRESAVIPAFLEFSNGCVLVAHNAPFDIGFLKAATARLELDWPAYRVIDTVPLARKLVSRDESPNHKLSSLAALFSTAQTPDHRALHDARATVDVLHALIGRVGSRGVTTLEELSSFTSKVGPMQRRKRYLAKGLPSAPGVYMFLDRHGTVLYVGTSTCIRTRVQSYFTAAEQRARMSDMIAAAEQVNAIECATVLEAQVRELRLIAHHDPPYNKRSKKPARAPWIKLTNEPFARLSLVRQVRDDKALYAGPFSSQHAAAEAIDALHEVVPLRRCTNRLSENRHTSACALAEMGRCGAPCDGSQSQEQYAAAIRAARDMLNADATAVVQLLVSKMSNLAASERYEEAACVRDRARALTRAAARSQEAFGLVNVAQIVAGQRRPSGGWELVCIRYGTLAGVAVSPRGADPHPYIDSLTATAAVHEAPTSGLGAALAQEIGLLSGWLTAAQTRLIAVQGQWVCPVHGAGAFAETFAAPS